MRNKGMLIILVILFVAALAGGTVGYFENKKENKNSGGNNTNEPKITYKYYLEDVEQSTMPTNVTSTDENGVVTTNVLYVFSRFVCTNDVTGDFNIEEWKFVPTEEKESVCSLYFVNSKYEVTLTITNGEASADNLKYIEREKNGTFVITPDEGYEFESSTCSDAKQTEWNPETNTLAINTIMEDVACKVVFKIKQLKMDVTVVNGEGNATETAEYGQSVEAIVTPKAGYEKPTIKCTNNQTATFENNKITIDKLTENTSCKVTFTATPVETFTLKVTIPAALDFTAGSDKQKVNSGATGSFTIKPNIDGVTVGAITCGGVTPSSTDRRADGSVKYTFLNMSKNITCTVTAE